MFEFLTHALKFFKLMHAGSKERKDFISSLANEHKASHQRFRQMVSVAFDDSGINELATKLKQAGFGEVSFDLLKSDDNTLAWTLWAKKI